MANAPVVQTLDQIMAELAPGAQGQIDNIGKRRKLLNTQATAQKAGLEAAKVKGFNTINNQMTGRGISFGGIAADEQAQYLAEKYLPAVAAVDNSVNERNLGLDNEAAKIQSDMRNMAFSTREGQKKDLNSWNMQQESLRAQAEQARLERESRERQAAADRSFQASQSALNRASTQAASAGPNQDQYLMDYFDDLANSASSAGKDWKKNYSTENSGVIGQVAARYGMSYNDAKNFVYTKRKQWYNF